MGAFPCRLGSAAQISSRQALAATKERGQSHLMRFRSASSAFASRAAEPRACDAVLRATCAPVSWLREVEGAQESSSAVPHSAEQAWVARRP